jgi:hypothetical protein
LLGSDVSSDAGADATAPEAKPKHRTTGEVIRVTAKRTIQWLGKVTGITPAFNPMPARLLF